MKLRNVVLTSLAALSLGAAENPPPVPADAPTEVSSQTLTLETTDKPLETVLQWISRRAGVNIVCNEVEQPRVTLRLVNVTWQEAIEQISERYDFVIEKKSERIWQLTRPPKVRMEFQDARLTVVLEALARQANVNIVIGDDIEGDRRLTMTLNGVPWKHALDVIVKSTGYTWVEQDYHIVRVVSKANIQKDLQTKVYRLNYTNGATAISSIGVALTSDGKAMHDARTNSLVLTDTPPALAAAMSILGELDQRTREVLVEMKFVEFSTAEAQKLGFDPISAGLDIADLGRVGATFTPFAASPTANIIGARTTPVPVDPMVGPGAIPTSTGNVSAQAQFEAIATLTSTEIIQTPKLLTLDNVKATINIGRELHFAEETVTTDGGGGNQRTLKEAASSPVTDGITIEVTPHITSDGYVGIELQAKDENAELVEFTSGSGATILRIKLPNKTKTEINTNIMVGDGQTAVIGGILKNKATETEGSIPGINKIPLLSWFFKKTTDSAEQRNLTLFITPHVIPNHDQDAMADETSRLSERISGIQLRPSNAQKEQNRTFKE
jgi:type IV pilus assembly protein PilQ